MASRNMLPRTSVHDTRDDRLGDPVVLRDSALRLPVRAPSSNARDISLRERDVVVGRSLSGASGATTFGMSVSGVFRVRSQPEVLRVDTGGIVAGVADAHAIGDGAILESVGQPVCLCLPMKGAPALPVAVPTLGADPLPASVDFCDPGVIHQAVQRSFCHHSSECVGRS